MKKISMFVTAALSLVATLITQQAGAQWSGGGKAGLNLANFKAAFNDNLKTRPGIVIGGFATYQVNPKISVQGELLFAQQGAKEYDGSYDFNYLHIPVSARYNVWNGLNVYTGPQIGFLLSAKINEDDYKEDIRDAVKGNDFLWMLGASYEMKNGIVADLRFVRGLMDVSDNDANVKNQAIQLTVGYRLKWGK